MQEIAHRRQIAVLVICDNSEDASDFMRMGVQGVIYRSASGSMVVEAVRRLAQGQAFLQSPNSAEIEVNDDLVGARVRKRLSDRELRIIAAIVQGYKNREIAGPALHQRAGREERSAQHLRQDWGLGPSGARPLRGASPDSGAGYRFRGP